MEETEKKTWKQRFLQRFLYGGLSRNTYQEVSWRCLADNISKLHLGMQFALMLSMVYVIAILSGLMKEQRLLVPYSFLMAVSAVLLLIGRRSSLWGPSKELVYLYAMAMASVVFAAILGTFASGNTTGAVSFMVLLVSLGFFFIDIPVRFDTMVLVSIILFSGFVMAAKDPGETRNSDLMNAVCYGALSMAVNWMASPRRYKEYVQDALLEKAAEVDPMTSLLTKDASKAMVQNMLVGGKSGTCVMIDLDKFKSINDTYGHLFGDEVIRCMGDVIREQTRKTDVCGRFGGDEFFLFLPELNAGEAVHVVRRLQGAFREHASHLSIPLEGTFSASIAETWDRASYDDLFKAADDALYEAKRLGGNQYHTAVTEAAVS